MKPMLQFRGFIMQRELVTAVVLVWIPRRKGFKLAGRVVPFSIFDGALYTGLPMMGEVVTFGDEGVCSKLGGLVRELMAKYVVEEKRMKLMQDKGGQKPKVFRHYIKVMKRLCKANQGQHEVELSLKLFCWMVMSALFFPHAPYGLA